MAELLPPDIQWENIGVEPSQLPNLLKAVALIEVVSYEDNQRRFAGSGFAVTCGNEHALIFTAWHVIKYAIEQSLDRNHRREIRDVQLSGYRFLPAAITQARKGGRIRVSVGSTKLEFGILEGVGWDPSIDMAVLLLKLPASLAGAPIPTLTIDSDIYAPGAPIVALGVAKEPPGPHNEDNLIDERTRFRLKIVGGRLGELQDGDSERDVPIYRTTIPFTGGMSGGPILFAPENPEEPCSVIGVISMAFADCAAITDNKQSALSIAMPIYLSYILDYPSSGDDRIADLCARGHIKDYGQRNSTIKVIFDPEIRHWKLQICPITMP